MPIALSLKAPCLRVYFLFTKAASIPSLFFLIEVAPGLPLSLPIEVNNLFYSLVLLSSYCFEIRESLFDYSSHHSFIFSNSYRSLFLLRLLQKKANKGGLILNGEGRCEEKEALNKKGT